MLNLFQLLADRDSETSSEWRGSSYWAKRSISVFFIRLLRHFTPRNDNLVMLSISEISIFREFSGKLQNDEKFNYFVIIIIYLNIKGKINERKNTKSA